MILTDTCQVLVRMVKWRGAPPPDAVQQPCAQPRCLVYRTPAEIPLCESARPPPQAAGEDASRHAHDTCQGSNGGQNSEEGNAEHPRGPGESCLLIQVVFRGPMQCAPPLHMRRRRAFGATSARP
jgi:hypothetical protein